MGMEATGEALISKVKEAAKGEVVFSRGGKREKRSAAAMKMRWLRREMDKDGSFVRVGGLEEDGEGVLEGVGEGCRKKSKEDKHPRLRRHGSGGDVGGNGGSGSDGNGKDGDDNR